MSIDRRSWTDDDGTGTTGTILDNAELQRVYDDVDARWTLGSYFATGTQDNVSLTNAGVEADVLVCQNTADVLITGFQAPASPAKPGKPLLIVSVGSGNVFLAHAHGSSSAANRMFNRATSGYTGLKAGRGYASYYYDAGASLWIMRSHDQGGYLAATFDAGNFTGNGSMTWTLASGDRTSGYWLRGNHLHYHFELVTTSVGGTLNTQLQINQADWGGYTLSGSQYRRLAVALDNGSSVADAYVAAVSGSTLAALKISGNWATSADNTYLYGDFDSEVT